MLALCYARRPLAHFTGVRSARANVPGMRGPCYGDGAPRFFLGGSKPIDDCQMPAIVAMYGNRPHACGTRNRYAGPVGPFDDPVKGTSIIPRGG